MQPISASISDRLHCGRGRKCDHAIFPAWRMAFMHRSTATIRLHFSRLSSPLNGACIRPLSNWPTHFRHSRVLHPLHVKPTLTEIANEVCTPRPARKYMRAHVLLIALCCPVCYSVIWPITRVVNRTISGARPSWRRLSQRRKITTRPSHCLTSSPTASCTTAYTTRSISSRATPRTIRPRGQLSGASSSSSPLLECPGSSPPASVTFARCDPCGATTAGSTPFSRRPRTSGCTFWCA